MERDIHVYGYRIACAKKKIKVRDIKLGYTTLVCTSMFTFVRRHNNNCNTDYEDDC